MAAGWILRKGTKRSGFRYEREDGRAERRPSVLERVDALRIPPAWTEVHIADSPMASIQAWGLDAKGRKQYRYHERAVAKGELRKYHRVRRLALDLPDIRRRVERDLRAPRHSRRRVMAGAVSLIGEGFFRVGSDRYAKENRTFGLTTLRKTHVSIENGMAVFCYRGKRSIRQRNVVADRRLVRFVREQLDTPGTRLFRYRAGDEWCDLDAEQLNEYIRGLSERAYTAKDFRTWGGTLRAATVLAEIGAARSEREAKKQALMALRFVSAELGNTPAICRKSYVHPIVLARYVDGGETISLRSIRAHSTGHAPEERALIRFLAKHFPERRRRSAKPRERERREELKAA